MSDAAKLEICSACSGGGIGRVGGVACVHCLGTGTLTYERAVHLCGHEYNRNRVLNKRNAEQHAEIMRLRGLLESVADGDLGAWGKQRVLLKTISGQRNTIKHMARRIAQLGGGNHPVEDFDV